MAGGLDVRKNVTIERIVRGDTVDIFTPDGKSTFDALLLACPLDAILPVLDASDEERALFGAVTWNDYHVIAVETDAPPPARYGFFAEHFVRARAGEPVFFYRRWLENQLVLYYTCPPAGATLDDSEQAVRRLVERSGGRVRELVLRHAWRYFPHVGAEPMRRGYYSRIEALQGQRRTWLTGELLSFTAVSRWWPTPKIWWRAGSRTGRRRNHPRAADLDDALALAEPDGHVQNGQQFSVGRRDGLDHEDVSFRPRASTLQRLPPISARAGFLNSTSCASSSSM